MLNFNYGPLRSWQQIAVGEMYDFPVPPSGFRRVSFDLISDAPVSVSVVAGDEAWLVARGEGLMSVSFSTDESVSVAVLGDPAAEVFLKTRDATQVVPESLDPTYTTIEPRPAGPSDEVRQMMHIQRLNNERRERMLLEEIQRLRKPAPVLVEPDPVPRKGAADPEPVEDKGAAGAASVEDGGNK